MSETKVEFVGIPDDLPSRKQVIVNGANPIPERIVGVFIQFRNELTQSLDRVAYWTALYLYTESIGQSDQPKLLASTFIERELRLVIPRMAEFLRLHHTTQFRDMIGSVTDASKQKQAWIAFMAEWNLLTTFWLAMLRRETIADLETKVGQSHEYTADRLCRLNYAPEQVTATVKARQAFQKVATREFDEQTRNRYLFMCYDQSLTLLNQFWDVWKMFVDKLDKSRPDGGLRVYKLTAALAHNQLLARHLSAWLAETRTSTSSLTASVTKLINKDDQEAFKKRTEENVALMTMMTQVFIICYNPQDVDTSSWNMIQQTCMNVVDAIAYDASRVVPDRWRRMMQPNKTCVENWKTVDTTSTPVYDPVLTTSMPNQSDDLVDLPQSSWDRIMAHDLRRNGPDNECNMMDSLRNILIKLHMHIFRDDAENPSEHASALSELVCALGAAKVYDEKKDKDKFYKQTTCKTELVKAVEAYERSILEWKKQYTVQKNAEAITASWEVARKLGAALAKWFLESI